MLRPKDIREALRREKYARAHKVVNKFATRFPSAEMSAWASAAHAEIAYAQRFPWWRHEVEGRIGDPPVTAAAPRAHTKAQKRTIRRRADRRTAAQAIRRYLGIAVPSEPHAELLRAWGFGRVVLADGSERDVPHGAVLTGRSRVDVPNTSRGVSEGSLGVPSEAMRTEADGE